MKLEYKIKKYKLIIIKNININKYIRKIKIMIFNK